MTPIIVDYDKLRTPFYEISIADAYGKGKVDLPHHILRLINKIEIREALVLPESQNETTTATITFIEGSREPGSQDSSLGTDGLYQISDDGNSNNSDIAGSMTNRPGSILDLRFSGSGGITFLSGEEKTTGQLSSKLIKNVDGKRVSRKYKNEPVKPRFLFEARNTVTITWGYKEDSSSLRRMSLSIVSIECSFSDSGATVTTVQCSDLGPFLNQITPKNAKEFGTITSTKNGALITFKDLKTDTIIRKLAEDAGWAAIVSKNLPADVLDKDKQKIWLADESLHNFLARMADQSNCMYKVIINPQNNKPTIFFIKRETLESVPPISKDKYFYLEYKHPGSLIKSVTLNAVFISPGQAASSSVDETGQRVEQDEEVVLVQSKNKEGQITNAPHPAVESLIQKTLGGNYTGKMNLTPNSNPDYIKAQASKEADISNRTTTVEIVTIGYPRFMPGIYPLKGIGRRFSGLYRASIVSHIIDNTGYVTTINAISHSLESENKKNPEAKNIQEKEQTVEVALSKNKNGVLETKVDEDNVTIRSFHEIYGKGTGQ